ncbi:sodium-independent anion transporter [Paenalkalicoccus suaedae]|uniref:Sodium-independent anion transporter n=1 Tax=Paenalkalicoccus suaedae TaxID=2592382 RepID=A0A859FEW9_9BACI|nr:SulP family inorganic anion transporter [Paenalkalicoccus suaedae]QKS71627.1 sodium-independent anion transporter [Paenalkalicoccus suaedae]
MNSQQTNHYLKHEFRSDLQAGLIVAVMLVPQGMAYALLAGMPPITGLYASIIPILIYAMIGTSRQLAVGPVAVVSLLVFAGVSQLAEPGSSEFVSYAILLMMMVGVIQVVMGVIRLGGLASFIPHAVISGFTSAAAIVIAFSQLKHVFGVSVPSEASPLQTITHIFMQLPNSQVITFSIALGSVALLLILKKIAPAFPAPLLVVIVTVLLVSGFNLAERGVSIIGDVPAGLPSLLIPTITIDAMLLLLPTALTISFIGFMESYAMAKVIAQKESYSIKPNRELIGLGAANVGGSFFGAFPVTGGFSRSAVNYEAGAKTKFAGVITAMLIALTLVFFTSYFYYLPNAVLAAIVLVAVYKLIDYSEAAHLFSYNRIDFALWMITFLATLVISVEIGLVTGIIAGMLVIPLRRKRVLMDAA